VAEAFDARVTSGAHAERRNDASVSAAMQNVTEVVERAYRAYFTVFQIGNPRAITPYWHTPSIFLSPAGTFALTSPKEAEQFFERQIYAMRQRGYARSVLTSVKVKQLADDLALVYSNGERYTREGELFERMSAVYTLRQADDAWRIATAVMTDPERPLAIG
jgi:hypothetical protein